MNMLKNVITITAFAFMATNSFAAEQATSCANYEKIGVVSASNVKTLDELNTKLNNSAEKAGATCYRIVSAGGNNYLYGNAEIYK